MVKNKIKLGDIFEINTPKGKAYLHYIFIDETVGELVRVLKGLYSERPANFEEIAGNGHRYYIYFPVSFALKRKIVDLVGFHPIDKFNRPKLMRDSHAIRGEFLGWNIVNTDTWQIQFVRKLSEKQKLLSPWGVWNDTLLIEKLVNNWSLDEWV